MELREISYVGLSNDLVGSRRSNFPTDLDPKNWLTINSLAGKRRSNDPKTREVQVTMVAPALRVIKAVVRRVGSNSNFIAF